MAVPPQFAASRPLIVTGCVTCGSCTAGLIVMSALKLISSAVTVAFASSMASISVQPLTVAVHAPSSVFAPVLTTNVTA